MKKITDEQLWDLADGLLSNAQKIEIEQELKLNAALQIRFGQIQTQKTLFSMSEMEKPKSDFAAQLLQNWQTEQQSVSLETNTIATNHLLLKMVFGLFGLLSITLFYIVFSNQGTSEIIDVPLPSITMPWKSVSLSVSIIGAVATVIFIEKIVVFRLRFSGL
jgi:hypothetical protein